LSIRKFLGGSDKSGTYTGQVRSLVLFSQTNLVLCLDISGEAGHIRFKTGHVHRIFSASMFDDCFERNLLIVCPIDPILLLLAL
jgi:hypothetical protein